MSASTITVDKVQPNIATYTTLSSALLQSPVITGGLGLQVTKTSDYTILDNDYYSTFLVDPSARAVNITLPAASSNTNRVITIKVTTKGGNVTVTGTIDDFTNMYLNRKDDYIEIISNGTNWKIKHCHCSYSTGWINTTDETTRHFGSMQITYSGASGAFVIGELITESTSGNTWIITADSGTVFTCKEATGTGFATNARTLTGATSGKTATVNGTTQNIDSNVIHGMGKNLRELNRIHLLSTDSTDNNSFSIGTSAYEGTSYGAMNQTEYQVDTNNIKLQTATGGFIIIMDNGSQIQYTGTSLYYLSFISYIK